MSMRKKIPETCRYWKEGKCFKGELQCTFVHGYVCPDDGRCWREYCSRMHINQKQHQQRDYLSKQFQNHQREGHRSRYRRSRSRSISPVRHQKAVCRGRSPLRYRSRSRSPPHHQSRGYGPPNRRSRSLSPSRVHDRSWSTSWHESKSRSPCRPQSRSCIPVGPQGRSCISEQSRNRIHSPQSRSRSHISAELRSRSRSPTHRRSRSIVHERQQDLDDIYADLDEEFDDKTEAIFSPKSDQDDQIVAENIGLSEIQAQITRNLLSPPTQMLRDILETARDKKSKDSPHEQENCEGPLSSNQNVEVDKVDLDLEEVGEEVDDIFARSIIRSVEDSIGSAFEEGLQRGKRKWEFQMGSNPSPPKAESLQKSTHDCDINYHTDWELKTALEDPPKPLEKQMQAPMAPSKILAGVSKSNNSSMWIPTLDRHQGQESKLKMIYQGGASDWEVETPYVERKDKTKAQRMDTIPGKETEVGSLPMMTYENVQITSERIPEQKIEKPTQSNTMPFPSGHSIPSGISSAVPQTVSHGVMSSVSSVSPALASYGSTTLSTSLVQSADLMREFTKARSSASEEGARSSRRLSDECKSRKPSESPKRSKRKRHKEKKSKRKKNFSESESDSSDIDDRKLRKNSSPETEKDKDEIEALLSKRDSLIKRVKLLVEQKNKMNEQRDDITKNHKGSRESLSSILDENLFLMKEIEKQIVKINEMVHKVTKEIELKKDVKQKHKSIQREKSESPHHSREKQKKLEHSPGREKHRRVSHYLSPDRSELDITLSKQKRQRSRSPVRKVPRQNRSGSPNPVFSNETTRQSSTESQRSQSPQKKHLVGNITETSKKEAILQGTVQQEVIKKEFSGTLQYAPHATQRTYIRYMDQGMHWCRLCSIFSESMPEYVDHLMTTSHMGRVKNDRKTWLAKAPKEEKEPKPANAQLLTIPLQGMEFLHSLPAFYCSLCDTFMRDKGEAVRHPESKMHISKYKVHRAKNPMYESTFLKAKTAAYAKFSVEKARKYLEAQLNLKEKNATQELEEKLLRQVKEKQEKNKCDKESRDEKVITESRDEKNRACGSIRVASRGPARTGDKKSDNQRHVDSSKRRPEGNQVPLQDVFTPKSKLDEEISRKGELQKNEKIHSDHDKGKIDLNIIENESAFSATEEPFKDKEEEKKCASTKLPLIGKMPFLKRRPGLSKSKEQLKTLTQKQEVAGQKNEPIMVEAKAETVIDIPLPNQEGKDEVKSGKNFDSLMIPVNRKSEISKEESEDKNIVVQEEFISVQDSEEISENITTSVFGDTKDISPSDSVISFEEHSSEPNISDNEKSESDDSKMYDIQETENDASSECAAAATLHALDLLSIQLPGLKPVIDVPPPLDILLPPGTEHETQSQKISELSLPLRTKGGSSGTSEPSIEPVSEVDETSTRVIRNSEIPLPPGTGDVSLIQSKTNLPPPPGTEECPNYLLGRDNDAVVLPANIIPVFKPSSQELSSGAWSIGSNSQEDLGVLAFPNGSDRNSDIPLPPGTEDEHCVHDVSSIPTPSGIAEDVSVHSGSDHKGIVAQPFIKKHSLEAFSSDSNSLDDIPIPLTGADITSSSLPLGIGHQHWPVVQTPSRPLAPSLSTNFTDWRSLRRTKRECTPPPPGTENLIVNELEDGPAELGEASMELSEGNESDDEHTKREATPPPPGTEDAEKETTPPPPGTEPSSRCVAINSSYPKNIPVAKSSPLTSQLKSKLSIKSFKDDMVDKKMPPLNTDSKLGLCFDSKEQFAKLSLQMKQEKGNDSIVSQQLTLEMNSCSSSCNLDNVPCLSIKEPSLFNKKVENTEGPDLKLQISSKVNLPESDTNFKDPSVSDCIKSETRHSEDFKGHLTKDQETRNLEMHTCEKAISLPPKCGGNEYLEHISDHPEVFETGKVFPNVKVENTLFKSMKDESKNAKEETPMVTSIVESAMCNKHPNEDNKHVEQYNNVHFPHTSEESDVKLRISAEVNQTKYNADFKDHLVNDRSENSSKHFEDLKGHMIKKDNSSQHNCDDVDLAQLGSKHSQEIVKIREVCLSVVTENNVNKSVKSESTTKEDIPCTSEIDNSLPTNDLHKDEHLEQCKTRITTPAESSSVGQVGSHNDLINQEHLKYQNMEKKWNIEGNDEQVDERMLTQSDMKRKDMERKESSHETFKATHSATTDVKGKEPSNELIKSTNPARTDVEGKQLSVGIIRSTHSTTTDIKEKQSSYEMISVTTDIKEKQLPHDIIRSTHVATADVKGKQSSHEVTQSAFSAAVDVEEKHLSHEIITPIQSTSDHEEENLRIEKSGLRRTPRTVKPRKAVIHEEELLQDLAPQEVTSSRILGTVNDEEEEPDSIETRLQKQTSESSERPVSLETEDPKEEHSPFRRNCRITKAIIGQQESKTQQLLGRRSTRGMKASLITDEKHKTELSASQATPGEEMNQSPKKLELDISEGNYSKELENRHQETELSSLRRTCRTTRSMFAEKPTQRKTGRGIRTAVPQEEKSKVESIASHTANRFTTTAVLDTEKDKAAVDTAPNEVERVMDEVVSENMEGNEYEHLKFQSCRITEISDTLELKDKEEKEESTREQKTNRSKRAVRYERTEGKRETKVPVHKKTRSALGKNRMSEKLTKIKSSVHIRRSRRVAVAASSAVTAQVQEISPSTSSPSGEPL
ncbi:uncharacterized protein [Panulirus ornatus]|uniref:uncharacterized protein n=1 Tax=Panulirus ornatus TaxID=150431 RepID=UPI003A891A36